MAPWGIMVYFGALLLLQFVGDFSEGMYLGRRLHPLYWNASNSIFKTSNNQHIVDVNIGDEIDFVCPYYPEMAAGEHPHLHHHGDMTSSEESPDGGGGGDGGGIPYASPPVPEYYTLYQVTKDEYDMCILQPNTMLTGERTLIVNCSNPAVPRWYTVMIDKYSASPQLPDFRKGHSYYFITTSTGTRSGLDNNVLGACRTKNMRITLKVCCESTTAPTPPTTTPTTTAHAPPTHHQPPRPDHTQPSSGGGGDSDVGGGDAHTQPPPTWKPFLPKTTKPLDNREENNVYPKNDQLVNTNTAPPSGVYSVQCVYSRVWLCVCVCMLCMYSQLCR